MQLLSGRKTRAKPELPSHMKYVAVATTPSVRQSEVMAPHEPPQNKCTTEVAGVAALPAPIMRGNLAGAAAQSGSVAVWKH
jgi:hypothetical protein